MNSLGRNDPCHCGSGKKYKKCCLGLDAARARKNRPIPPPAIPEGHFIAEVLPKVDEAIDRLLAELERGRCENAEPRLAALLRQHPRYHMTNYAMGTYLALLKEDPKGAIPYFEKAVSVFPPLAEAHYNLAGCYTKVLRIAEAVASLRQAIRYSDDDGYIAERANEQLLSLEKILLKDNPQENPFPTLDAYIENQKLFDLAFEKLRTNADQEAVDLFQQVLAQNPRHVQSHGNIALAYARLGQTAVALEHLDKAIALDPTYEPAIQNRSIIARLKEGEPLRPIAMAETEYYRERLEAQKKPARSSWWRR
jgi:tetratricopeptide (TPR) repeat protein